MANAGYSLLRRLLGIFLLVVGVARSSAKRPSRVLTQNSPSVRRIMSEWKQVQAEGLAMGEGGWSVRGNSSDTFRLKPVGNMFEWHFTFLGAKDSPFEGGLYHGSICLPADYPLSGPSVRLLNASQRFKVGSRICLSASEYHQETWQPSWTVTSLVTALVAHMTEPAVELGSVQGATRSQKRRAAARSRSFECAVCGCCHGSFPEEQFPKPKGLVVESGKDVPPELQPAPGAAAEGGESRGRGSRRRGGGGGGEVLGAAGAAAVGVSPREAAGLAGRSRLSWTVRVVSSKPFLLVLALILASVYLNQP
ncbi:unnamed protein product [Pylaiella littoralis]